LQELSAQVERLIRLSSGLLFLSRSDQQQLSFQPVDLELREWMEILVEQLEPLAHEKELQISTQIPEDLSVYGDSDHLIRLFLNILENTLKYTPVGGQITITAVKAPEEIQITIHNTGPGISPEHLPHLFERFYRVQEDRSSQTGGSGLGLTIALEIVRLHRGDINVQSELGQGVTVTVYLPSERSPMYARKDV
jgi:signal transduction histidine kinase